MRCRVQGSWLWVAGELSFPTALFDPRVRPREIEALVDGSPLAGRIVVKCHYNFVRKAGTGLSTPLL